MSERTRTTRWGPIVFIVAITAGTCVGIPLYFHALGIDPLELVVFATYSLATSLAITVGYHRLFAHRTFEAHPLVQLLALFFGAGAFEQSALKWSSVHRNHHRHTDTERDPHNILRGFFYAHVGWILFWRHPMSFENVEDLHSNRLVHHQHKHYRLWSLVAGLVVPVALGVVMERWLGGLLLGVAARLFFVLNAAFFINSFAHTFGDRPYDGSSSARDHWLGAVLTNGEGYHNFHHRFPSDYRNGARWHQWDPSKWLIRTLELVGLAWGVRRTTASAISAARVGAAEA